MNPELLSRLKKVTNLPSPPGVAAEIIKLAQDPDLELELVATKLANDPALSAKILRIANSPFYAQRRQCTNLGQALVLLGLNATVTLALSFSLLSSLRSSKVQHLDYTYFWQRSLTAGAACRALANRNQLAAEELFLAALLQDIGMMVLDLVMPEIYQDTQELQRDHTALQAHERKQIGADHAEAGAWLLESWNIPPFLQGAVAASHDVTFVDGDDAEPARRCVILSGLIADLWLSDSADPAEIARVAGLAKDALGLDAAAFGEVMASVREQIPEIESLFEVDILDASQAEYILDQARETLMIRNLQSLQEVSSLKRVAENLKSRTIELEEETRHDKLTGVANRRYLYELLNKGFGNAFRFGWPFSVAFVDLDDFKQINDTYGHPAGDQVLAATAGILRRTTRSSDTVARYGGEEFVLLLPGTDQAGAQVVGNRVVKAFAQTRHAVGDTELIVTVSVGVASFPHAEFETVDHIVNAADQALYAAKGAGKNRMVVYDSQDLVQPLDVGRLRGAGPA